MAKTTKTTDTKPKTTAAKPEAKTEAKAEKPAAGAAQGGVFSLLGQYVKDMSFECFQPPFKVGEQQVFDLGLSVGSEKVGEDQFAVRMKLRAEGKTQDGKSAYLSEMEYVGVFTLKNIPAQHVAPILGIEAPSLMFPYARQVLMQSIIDGGFRPGLIQPINFAQLFMQQQQQAQKAQ